MNQKMSDMDPKEIRIALFRVGVSQSGLARYLGVSVSMVNRVIDGTGVSDRIRKQIAKTIDIDIKRIWPSTYLYGGGPRKAGRPFGSRNLHAG